MVVVMTPKLLSDRSALGAPNWARLNTLNASARKRTFTRSVMETYFDNPRSNCEIPGARNALRPRFPKVCEAGVENAAALIQSFGVDPPARASETPAT